jgi:hypothetical protein
MRMEVFGREGKFTLKAGQILDKTDDQLPGQPLKGETGSRDMLINSFFHDPLPATFPGFQVIRSFRHPSASMFLFL